MKISRKIPAIITGLLLSFIVGSAFADSAQADRRYVIQGGTVYDKETDLTWARCSVGQQWADDANGCAGSVQTFNSEQAQLQGSGSFRVPTNDELFTLVDYERLKTKHPPTIDAVAFPDMDREHLHYWTSNPSDLSGAWGVNFYDGGGYNRTQTYAVRLVRGGH